MADHERKPKRTEFEAMLEQGWILISPGGDVFCYDRPHELTADCWCKPTVERVDGK